MAVKNFVFVNENQFTWRSGQNYTLSYYQLTFTESNRLIVSVICAWLSDKSNFNNYKIVKNTSSMKQNNWTTSRHTEWSKAREGDFDLTGKCDWKVTGNAQPGACVDVLPRCCVQLVQCEIMLISSTIILLFNFEKRHRIRLSVSSKLQN